MAPFAEWPFLNGFKRFLAEEVIVKWATEEGQERFIWALDEPLIRNTQACCSVLGVNMTVRRMRDPASSFPDLR